MPNPRQPNVLFFIVDDTCLSLLSTYGGRFPMPALDALARRGVRLDRAYCASAVCTPSRFNYLTGRYGSRARGATYLADNPPGQAARIHFNTHLDDGDTPTLGKLFAHAGYQTGFAGKWHNHRNAASLGLDLPPSTASADDPHTAAQLADLYDRQRQLVRRDGGYDYAEGIVWANPHDLPLASQNRHHPEWSMDAALRFLEARDRSRPFLLHYASTCYHGPDIVRTLQGDPTITPAGRIPALPTGGMAPRDALVQRVRDHGFELGHDALSYTWMDEQLRALLDAIDRAGDLHDTVVVFCADHNNEPAKGSCYEAGSRVPAVLAGPGIAQGHASDALVANVDLLPTLLELCGLAPPPEPTDGRSFAHLLRDPRQPHRDHVYLENGFSRAVRRGRLKLVAQTCPPRVLERLRRGDPKAAANHYGDWSFGNIAITAHHYPAYHDPEQLYDLEADPAEQHNRIDDPRLADARDALRATLREEAARLPHPFPFEDHAWRHDPAYEAAAARARDRDLADIRWWPTEKVRRLAAPTDPFEAMPTLPR